MMALMEDGKYLVTTGRKHALRMLVKHLKQGKVWKECSVLNQCWACTSDAVVCFGDYHMACGYVMSHCDPRAVVRL